MGITLAFVWRELELGTFISISFPTTKLKILKSYFYNVQNSQEKLRGVHKTYLSEYFVTSENMAIMCKNYSLK